MIIDERVFSKLTDEQKKAVEAAQSPEELLAFAKETGYELSEEQLGTVSQGSWCEHYCSGYYCPSFSPEEGSVQSPLPYGQCSGLCFKHQE